MILFITIAVETSNPTSGTPVSEFPHNMIDTISNAINQYCIPYNKDVYIQHLICIEWCPINAPTFDHKPEYHKFTAVALPNNIILKPMLSATHSDSDHFTQALALNI
jgi:hypothetical protein